ncbi:MAG: hypothetical protein ACQGVC_11090 [Myxococcota bacterium]
MLRGPVRSIAFAATLTLCGCTNLFWEAGLPWSSADFRVASVDPRGPYLDVRISGGGTARRFFSPRSEVCEAMLREGAVVTLNQSGGYGPFRSEGVDGSDPMECPIVGIGDLEQFRRSRSQGGGYGQSPIRRGSDRIQVVHRDEEYLYVRGGFSIGAMFGWSPGPDQVIALVPRVPECQRVERGGSVSTLFRQAGTPALGIAVEDGLCPIRALIAMQPGEFDGFADTPGS